MPLTSNLLKKQVDLPIWEWLRFAPTTSTSGLSCSCVADYTNFNETSGRYIYYLFNATNFWRYDTVTDTYMQLASPGITPLTASSMRFSGTAGYWGKVFSATSTTINTGMPGPNIGVGYRIRIISGRGAGQERLITSVSDPIVADFGGASAGAATSLTDSNRAWTFNNWVGCSVRIVGGSGINQVRKILYNSATVLTVADPNNFATNSWSVPISPTAGTAGWTAPSAGSQYQIEYSTLTVDTAWDVIPDNTSRFVIQAGGIFLVSGAAATPFLTMQYYSVLEDIWYAKPVITNISSSAPSDISIERFTENSALWHTSVAGSGSSNAAITDSTVNWANNQWTNYPVIIWSGTGRGQLAIIANNTSNTINFTTNLTTAPDTTSRYSIYGYDGGTFSSTSGRIVNDTTKSWSVNRWANYAIRIISGTGLGQMRQILSNGSNSLVTYEPWNVQPDNTSRYVIIPNFQDIFITSGGSAETYVYRTGFTGDTDSISHSRILDEGAIQVAAALLTDGTSTATHEIYEQRPVPITSISGTTTITATTPFNHELKVGQWVSMRGITNAAADVYNVTGKVQIATVPTATTFTYTPFAAGTGTYQYSNNVTVSTTVLPDAAKYHADLATGGSTTSATFSRAQPSNINGWYAYGTNIAAGAQVTSGAGTTTVNFNLTGAGTPTGTIIFTKWPLPVTSTYSSGGGANVFSGVMSGATAPYITGWLATGTNMGTGGVVTGGAGTTTVNYLIQNFGTPAGTITFSNPVNGLLPVTATYSSGSGTSITLSASIPSYLTGWYVTGTNISNGTTVTGGAGTATITLSTATSGTPAGTITFYPPSTGVSMIYLNGAAPTLAATGMSPAGTGAQLVAQNINNGTVQTPIAAVSAVAAGFSKYVITRRDLIGQQYNGQNLMLSGTASGTSNTTVLQDLSVQWTATGSGGSAGATSFTIGAAGSPLHNGFLVAGTGIATGTKVLSGGGTTTITVDTPLTGTVSGTVTFTAWNPNNLTNRRIKLLTLTGLGQEQTVTGATATGNVTFSAITTAPGTTTSYSILPTVIPGAGSYLSWLSDSSVTARKGKFVIRARGGNAVGFDRIDITDDTFYPLYTTPITETLSTGSMYAYDQLDRIYFTKDVGATVGQRVYYLDTNTGFIHGAGIVPYLGGTAQIGNKMEIFTTADGLKYLWLARQSSQEHFRTLLFF